MIKEKIEIVCPLSLIQLIYTSRFPANGLITCLKKINKGPINNICAPASQPHRCPVRATDFNQTCFVLRSLSLAFTFFFLFARLLACLLPY